MICPNCEKGIKFRKFIFMRTFSMRCDHCKAELKMKSQGFSYLAFCLIGVIGGASSRYLTSFFVKSYSIWIDILVFLTITIIFGFIFIWCLWKFWKVMPRNEK
jgi:uncharacterized protein (DUF983 family)